MIGLSRLSIIEWNLEDRRFASVVSLAGVGDALLAKCYR